MNEADLYTIFEQHGSVQLYETRSVVYDLHVKVDYVCFSGKSYPLPVLIFPPNVVPLCGSKSTRGICEFPKTVSLKIWPHCQGFKGSTEYSILFRTDLAHFNQRWNLGFILLDMCNVLKAHLEYHEICENKHIHYMPILVVSLQLYFHSN